MFLLAIRNEMQKHCCWLEFRLGNRRKKLLNENLIFPQIWALKLFMKISKTDGNDFLNIYKKKKKYETINNLTW